MTPPVRWSAVSAIFRAELRSVLRDRRTMVATVLVPVLLYPLGGLGFASMAMNSVERLQSEVTKLCMQGAPEDVAVFGARRQRNACARSRASKGELYRNSAHFGADANRAFQEAVRVLMP